VAVGFFDGGQQPLATIAWPASMDEAASLTRPPLDFVRCTECGHVFNMAFDFAPFPYSEKPNLMFNEGVLWSEHIVRRSRDILSRLPKAPEVVDVGYGDGGFLASRVSNAPRGASSVLTRTARRTGYLALICARNTLKPHDIVRRHVPEHLVNPLEFLQPIAAVASALEVTPLAHFELPCIDNAVAARRTVDFYYEHNSQFTMTSFVRMLTRRQAQIIEIGQSCGNEVMFGIVRLGGRPSRQSYQGGCLVPKGQYGGPWRCSPAIGSALQLRQTGSGVGQNRQVSRSCADMAWMPPVSRSWLIRNPERREPSYRVQGRISAQALA